jgi:prolactin regulatory element-binding protein
VPLPSSTGEGSTFRAARYILLPSSVTCLILWFVRHHPQDQRILFSVINSVPPRTRKTKTMTRRAYICIWNTETWDVERIKKVGDRGLTCFDVRYEIFVEIRHSWS